MDHVIVYRLPQTEEQHQEELAKRARGIEPPLFILDSEDFEKWRKLLFDQPPPHNTDHERQNEPPGLLLFALPPAKDERRHDHWTRY